MNFIKFFINIIRKCSTLSYLPLGEPAMLKIYVQSKTETNSHKSLNLNECATKFWKWRNFMWLRLLGESIKTQKKKNSLHIMPVNYSDNIIVITTFYNCNYLHLPFCLNTRGQVMQQATQHSPWFNALDLKVVEDVEESWL